MMRTRSYLCILFLGVFVLLGEKINCAPGDHPVDHLKRVRVGFEGCDLDPIYINTQNEVINPMIQALLRRYWDCGNCKISLESKFSIGVSGTNYLDLFFSQQHHAIAFLEGYIDPLKGKFFLELADNIAKVIPNCKAVRILILPRLMLVVEPVLKDHLADNDKFCRGLFDTIVKKMDLTRQIKLESVFPFIDYGNLEGAVKARICIGKAQLGEDSTIKQLTSIFQSKKGMELVKNFLEDEKIGQAKVYVAESDILMNWVFDPSYEKDAELPISSSLFFVSLISFLAFFVNK